MPAHYGSFFPEPETTFLMALSGKHQAQGEGCFLGCALLWVGAVQDLWLIQALLPRESQLFPCRQEKGGSLAASFSLLTHITFLFFFLR